MTRLAVLRLLTLLMPLVASAERVPPENDRNTKGIPQSDSRSSPPPAATRDVPDAVRKALTNGSVGKKYGLSFHMNPSHLEGDFNGDGKMDAAVLVRERSTGKLGIAIVHGMTGKITILGAGVGVGNGGDDFKWMDFWRVYSKNRDTDEGATHGPPLRGDALLVEKTESASALIYWNGKRYAWSQQGD